MAANKHTGIHTSQKEQCCTFRLFSVVINNNSSSSSYFKFSNIFRLPFSKHNRNHPEHNWSEALKNSIIGNFISIIASSLD